MTNPQDAIADGGQTRVGVRARERERARACFGETGAQGGGRDAGKIDAADDPGEVAAVDGEGVALERFLLL